METELKAFEKDTWTFSQVYSAVKSGAIYLDPPYTGEYGTHEQLYLQYFGIPNWKLGAFPPLFFVQNSTAKWLDEHPEYKGHPPYEPLDGDTYRLVYYICLCKDKAFKDLQIEAEDVSLLDNTQITIYTIPLCEYMKSVENQYFYKAAAMSFRVEVH